MKKAGFYMLLVVVFILSLAAGVFANEDAIKIYLNNERMNVSANPVIENGTTLVPMRSVFESLGMDVMWDGSTKSVTGSGNNVTLKLTVGDKKAYVDGKEVYLEVPAKIINGTTMVPIRFISESAGCEVEWDGATRSIRITSVNNNSTNNNSSNDLYVENGTGKYSGYMKLKGHPDEDKYQIYFKGNADSFTTTIEDLRGINLNEIITWEFNGKLYKNTRKELYGFFADTTWFRNNLNGITNYTLTHDWFMETFGDTYWDWAEGIGYSNDAARWVERYFRPTVPNWNSNVTLTPDTMVVVEESVSEEEQQRAAMEWVEEQKRLAQEALKITEEWIDYDTLNKKAQVHISIGNNINERVFVDQSTYPSVNLYKISLPNNWQSKGNQNEVTVDGIRIKRENNTDFYNVEDLRKLGIVKD